MKLVALAITLCASVALFVGIRATTHHHQTPVPVGTFRTKPVTTCNKTTHFCIVVGMPSTFAPMLHPDDGFGRPHTLSGGF